MKEEKNEKGKKKNNKNTKKKKNKKKKMVYTILMNINGHVPFLTNTLSTILRWG